MSLGSVWISALARPGFRLRLVVTFPLLVLVFSLLAHFLNYAEARPGVVLPDPFLALFAARDVTWLTFALIYVGSFTGLFFLLYHPDKFLLALQSYMIMLIFRMAGMFVMPLEAPPGMITLKDPLAELIGTSSLLTKDLFFSGHTSTLFLLFLTGKGKVIKTIFFMCTIVVALCVMLQHVHYTVDVLAAPFFAFGAYRLVLFVDAELRYFRSEL